MKHIFKKIILWLLHKEAAYMLKRHNPKIIAITGSVGKTTTKDAIYTVLHNKIHIRKNQKSFNSEIGVPLTVLGLSNGWNNPIKWLLNVVKGAHRAFFQKKYPKYLVLEMGVERPGDIDLLTQWIKPHVVVLTALPKVPVHVEFFEDKESVWREKRQLVKACQPGGVVILNNDDAEVMNTQVPEGCTKITYGSLVGSEHRLVENAPYYLDGKLQGQKGLIVSGKNQKPEEYFFQGVLGVQSLLPFACASAVQEALGLETDDLDIKDFIPTPGRMRVLPGRDNTTLVDDSYNASPVALAKGLEEVAGLEKHTGRKIAILGDMLELGQQSVEMHRKTGEMVQEFGFSDLITVGIRAAHYAEGAHEQGMSLDRIASFSTSNDEELHEYLDNLREEGDLFYIKGSQGSRMERVTRELLSEEITPEEVLPRHDKVWLQKK